MFFVNHISLRSLTIELHNLLLSKRIGINQINFPITACQQYLLTSPHILGINYILYFESIVIFDRRVVVEEEFDELFEDDKEMTSKGRHWYSDRFLEETAGKSAVDLHVDFLTVQLAKYFVAGQLLLIQQVHYSTRQRHLGDSVLLLHVLRVVVHQFVIFLFDISWVVVLKSQQFADSIELTHKYPTLDYLYNIRTFFLNILYQNLIKSLTLSNIDILDIFMLYLQINDLTQSKAVILHFQYHDTFGQYLSILLLGWFGLF